MYTTYIFDLDNTIYPVSSIGEALFAPLFILIENAGEVKENLIAVKHDIMRRPFQLVAKENNFSADLTHSGINLLKALTFERPIAYFEDYIEIRKLSGDKFLVTTGFEKLQWSKVRALGIEKDFKKIYIVDPAQSNLTKKDVFQQIITENNLSPHEIIVVGDDPESEIKAASALGITTVLYEKEIKSPNAIVDFRIDDFGQLHNITP